jgi:hypothetical protein
MQLPDNKQLILTLVRSERADSAVIDESDEIDTELLSP